MHAMKWILLSAALASLAVGCSSSEGPVAALADAGPGPDAAPATDAGPAPKVRALTTAHLVDPDNLTVGRLGSNSSPFDWLAADESGNAVTIMGERGAGRNPKGEVDLNRGLTVASPASPTKYSAFLPFVGSEGPIHVVLIVQPFDARAQALAASDVDVTVTTDGATGTPLEGTPTAQAGTYRFEGDVPGPLSSPSFVVVTLTKPSAGLAITGPNIGPATAASRRDTVRYPPERTRLLQVVAQRALSRTR